MAPFATKRASLHKDSGAYSGAVVDGEALDIKYCTEHHALLSEKRVDSPVIIACLGSFVNT